MDSDSLKVHFEMLMVQVRSELREVRNEIRGVKEVSIVFVLICSPYLDP